MTTYREKLTYNALTVEELASDIEQYKLDEYITLEQALDMIYEIYDEIGDIKSLLEDIKGIDIIEEASKELDKLSVKLY